MFYITDLSFLMQTNMKITQQFIV